MGKYKLTWRDLTLRDFKIYLFALFKAFIPKKKIKSFKTKKGNLEKTAIIGGIMGAKETSRLIPLCHNIPINHINIEVIKNDKKFTFIVKSTVKTNANTGVEMEALTAVSISCLTIYDMCKYLNKKIIIQNIHLVSKTGGKSNI